MLKKELRKYIRTLKRQFTNNELRELSLPVLQRLKSDERLAKAKTILMYYSLDDEVNTHDIIDEFVMQGKTVLLPIVISGEDMEIRNYGGRNELRKGAYGIMEPTGTLFSDYGRIDVAVIPGMAFDVGNNRLGRGKGYYDRMLTKLCCAYKIGVCFDFQKLPELPVDEYDIKMDVVI